MRLEDVHWGVRRPGRWRRASGALSLASVLAGGLLIGTNDVRLYPGTFSETHPAAYVGRGLMFVSVGAFLVYLISLLMSDEGAATPSQGSLELREGVLVLSQSAIDSEEHVALSDAESGWEDARGRAVLRLRDGRELTLGTSGGATGEILRAAGVTPEQRVARFPVGSALAALPGGRAFGCVGMSFVLLVLFIELSVLGGLLASLVRGLAGGQEVLKVLLACVPCGLGLAGLLALLAPRRAVVGTDGIAIEGLFRRRFLPFEEISAVQRDDGEVCLQRRRGWKVRLPHAPGGEGLAPRLEAAMASHGGGEAEARLAALDRGGRSVEQWLDDLRRLADGEASYRADALPPEQLAAVVEDASMSPERRVAAAVSVTASGDEEAQRRVRVAAQTCADEELHEALLEAAEAERPEAALGRVARR